MMLSELDLSRHHSACLTCHQKTVNQAPIAGGVRFRHNFHSSLYPM